MSPMPRAPKLYGASSVLRLVPLGLLLLLFAVPLSAEVSVVTDAHGKYLKTLLLTGSQDGRRVLWGQIRTGVDPSALLNAHGDRTGDSRPVIAEQPGTRQPWVLWTIFDGHDREIAFSTWTGGRWQEPRLLETSGNQYDDLDPRVAFDSAGNPVAVWWRKEPIPRVYLSLYLHGVWTPTYPVSDAAVPSRDPSLRLSGSLAVVTFRTPLGQTVLFLDLRSLLMSPEGNGPLDGPVPPPDQRPDPGTGGNLDRPDKTASGSDGESDLRKPAPID
jgi:hypothetical protein